MNNFIHPEQRLNEVFFTNSDFKKFNDMKWTTRRMGKVAYDGNGNVLGVPNWFPIFVDVKELKSSGKTLSEIRREFRS